MIATALPLLLILAGCASVTRDRFMAFPARNQSAEQLQRDRFECDGIAMAAKGSEQATQAALAGGLGTAAVGAGLGAIDGAIWGAAFGMSGTTAGYGAAAGAAVGLAVGIIASIAEIERRYASIYTTCMTARGYVIGEGAPGFGPLPVGYSASAAPPPPPPRPAPTGVSSGAVGDEFGSFGDAPSVVVAVPPPAAAPIPPPPPGMPPPPPPDVAVKTPACVGGSKWAGGVDGQCVSSDPMSSAELECRRWGPVWYWNGVDCKFRPQPIVGGVRLTAPQSAPLDDESACVAQGSAWRWSGDRCVLR